MSNTDKHKNTNTHKHKGKRPFLLVVVPLTVLIAGLAIYLHGGRYISTDNAYIKAEKIPVSSEVSGNIVEVYVNENQAVKTGQPLFRIDDAPFVIAVEQARAKLAQTRNDITSLKASYVSKQAEIRLARANHDYAVQEQKRLANQAVSSYVPKIKQDKLTHDAQISQQKINLLEDELKQIVAAGGSNDSPVEQHPLYRAARAGLERAELDLQHVLVKAPRDGTISKVPNIGQFISAGTPVTVVVDDKNLWIEANLTETDLTHVRKDQPVSIEVDTYPGVEWQGEVASISPATGAEFSLIPAQNATGNWVKIAQRLTVRIRILPKKDGPTLRAGMSTYIEIDTGYQRKVSDIRLTI